MSSRVSRFNFNGKVFDQIYINSRFFVDSYFIKLWLSKACPAEFKKNGKEFLWRSIHCYIESYSSLMLEKILLYGIFFLIF